MADKVDLLEYASRTVDFTKYNGGTHYAICPFHSEKTESLAIKDGTQTFYCFGCGRTGNLYKWIMWTENLNFDQAVQKVADLTGSDLHDYVESESLSFYKMLKKIGCNGKRRDTAERKILDIEKDYRQRFIPELPQEWIDEGIEPDIMRKYEIRTDPSSNRIVYPVYDSYDRLIGVKGRTRFSAYKTLKIAKYMNYNSVGILDYFQGLKQARSYIAESGQIIIFEGIKSVMKADGWGYHNCVSAETSTLNDYQIELLIQLQVKNVIIAFDKDVKLGKIQNCTQLLKKFTNVYVVYDKWGLLKDKDSPPDKGESVWRTLYERRVKI